ncbi:LSm14 family protein [Skeletonema marinoi]|uniref:LSm14 family protein n=2 Tax=Skeletonema marinoi TaxID=267567 RepID=A0AAD8Y8G8_9STRA|nr:LSm14 family protein [Skeletonema marinoi]|mmetsp:Transcript_27994/g.56198  ORF Transcript_27994/g.56198 Transcript_27994/m.56198 type:complete len:311 (+) Transcript_27994:138-1070(+)
MASNPLIGNRISLISKKNIRYEGVLYSINESDATVALQDVKSFGTEGRELLDTTGQTNFVPPQDTVHTYLLFRGQDIKDLHVHEKQGTPAAAADTTPAKEEAPPAAAVETKKEESISEPETKKETSTKAKTESKENKPNAKKGGNQKKNMVGSGASLLNKKARGAKGDQIKVGEDFDFESNLEKFENTKISADDEEEDDIQEEDTNVYSAGDFFDSISCDAIDKANGIDNRLRGADERNLNLDTFGATSLGNNRRRYGGRGRGRGGRGRGRGRGRGGRGGGSRSNNSRNYEGGPAPRQNNRWKESSTTSA